MNLLELAEPLFQYICRINRLGRAKADISAAQIRADLKSLFARMRETAAQEPGLLPRYEMKEDKDGKYGVELALIFFADYMVRESGLASADEWQDIAEEYDEFGGDDKFFDLLDRTLAERGDEADEQLAVFYTCLGLGFVGGYVGEPEMIRRKMHDCGARIKKFMDEDDRQKICRETYEHTDTRPLNLPAVGRLVNWCVLFGLIVVAVFVVSGVLYYVSQEGLNHALTEITDRERVVREGEP